MKRIIIFSTLAVVAAILFLSCESSQPSESVIAQKWDLKALKNRAEENLDSNKWNKALFE